MILLARYTYCGTDPYLFRFKLFTLLVLAAGCFPFCTRSGATAYHINNFFLQKLDFTAHVNYRHMEQVNPFYQSETDAAFTIIQWRMSL
jgi:hypothetical protein